MKRSTHLLLLASFLAVLVAPTLALAAPRSGGSFSGRGGFRSGGSSFSGRGYTSRPAPSYGNRGPNFVFLPSFGWGLSPFGGYGGGFGFGSLLMVGLLGVGALMVVRALRARSSGARPLWQGLGSPGGYAEEYEAAPERAFVYKVQLGLGRSARGIQQRLESFAAEGDTSSEAGLAILLQQTSLELLREQDSIRYASTEGLGPLAMSAGEAKLNSLALNERARFQVERVRGADGKVRRSDVAASTNSEVLEYLLVTVVVATREPLPNLKALTDREELDVILSDLGGIPPESLLGLEVIWTPADPEDALTEAELLVTYPNLRSV